MRIRKSCWLPTALAALFACSSGMEASTATSANGVFTVLADGGPADTVESFSARPLRIQLPTHQSGIEVRFGSAFVLNVNPIQFCDATTGPLSCNEFVARTTDSSGTVTINHVFRPSRAAITWIHISVPSLGLTDSLAFTVLPGDPVKVRALRRDSTAYVGRGYAIGYRFLDQFNNVASGGPAVTFASDNDAALVSTAGVFTGRHIGRGYAVLTAGTMVDTAWITVPPVGVIAADQIGIVSVNLDGSGLRHVAPYGDPLLVQLPIWLPDGEILFSDTTSKAVNQQGVVRQLWPGDTLAYDGLADAASDGSVAFTGLRRGLSFALARIWRIPPGGGPVTQLPIQVSDPDTLTSVSMPSFSADGKRIVFLESDGQLRTADVATGAVLSSLRMEGATTPRWSPAGSHIVFSVDSYLDVVDTNFANLRRVGVAHTYHARPDWSPDGTWLIAATDGPLELINLATNQVLPLGWSTGFAYPAWKR